MVNSSLREEDCKTEGIGSLNKGQNRDKSNTAMLSMICFYVSFI